MKLPAARMPRLRSFVSVPVTFSDGSLYGTFCAAGLTSDKDLTKRDKALMDVLASAAAVIIEPEVRSQARRTEIEGRLDPVIAAGGPVVVLQPIVDLATGAPGGRRGAEPLPGGVGHGPRRLLRRGAQRRARATSSNCSPWSGAAEHLSVVDGYVAMNVSPATLLTPGVRRAAGPAARWTACCSSCPSTTRSRTTRR